MAKQARCWRCMIHFVWAQDHPLTDALCPRCKGGLDRTSHYLRQEKSSEPPVYVKPGERG